MDRCRFFGKDQELKFSNIILFSYRFDEGFFSDGEVTRRVSDFRQIVCTILGLHHLHQPCGTLIFDRGRRCDKFRLDFNLLLLVIIKRLEKLFNWSIVFNYIHWVLLYSQWKALWDFLLEEFLQVLLEGSQV